MIPSEQIDAIICTFSPDISISNQMFKDNNTRTTDKPIYERLYAIRKNKIAKSRRNSSKAPPECTFSPVLEGTKVFNQKHLNDTNHLTPDQRREQLYQYGKLKINYERELEESKKPARKAHNDDHIECTFFPVTNHARGRELRSRLQRSQPL